MKIIADIFEYTRKHAQVQFIYFWIPCKKGATADIELAYTLADGLNTFEQD
jgi:methylmalonyl-CoA mutase N-terminal domain/subunit